MSDNGKRRKWSAADKLRIVLAGMQPGVEVSDLCRREGLNPVQFYAGKKQLLGSASRVFEAPRRPSAQEQRREAEVQRLRSVVASGTALASGSPPPRARSATRSSAGCRRTAGPCTAGRPAASASGSRPSHRSARSRGSIDSGPGARTGGRSGSDGRPRLAIAWIHMGDPDFFEPLQLHLSRPICSNNAAWRASADAEAGLAMGGAPAGRGAPLGLFVSRIERASPRTLIYLMNSIS
jgi:transposase